MSRELSARQEECLRLTAFLTDKEIAVRLGLAEATVKKHVHEGCRRLGVNRRKAALAILERNVPGPKDPMAGRELFGVSGSVETESGDVVRNQDPATLDLGRSGSGAGRIQPHGTRGSGAGAPDAGTGGRRGAGESAGAAAAGAERGLGDGPGGRPERRLGYRPPPTNRLTRVLILFAIVVLCAFVVRGLADLLTSYAVQAGEIDRLTTPVA